MNFLLGTICAIGLVATGMHTLGVVIYAASLVMYLAQCLETEE